MSDWWVTPWTRGAANVIAKWGNPIVTAVLAGFIVVSIVILFKGSFLLKSLWTAFLLTP